MFACTKRLTAALPFALFATTLAAAPLFAQSAQRWSLQGSLIYVGTFGDAYEGMTGGPGGELQLRYTPGQFSLGIGGQTSMHKVDIAEYGEEDATLSGGFIEPRYVFDVGSDRYAPYGSARLAFLKQSLTLEGLEASASGTQINVGGGVLIRLSPRVNLDLGATFGAINFGDVKLTYLGESLTVDGTSGSGQNLVLRAGVAIGLR
jgi:hypothetical protein